MRRTTTLLSFLFSAILISSCKKNPASNNGLPPATQTGSNTLGFLLNGQPWMPQGFNGTANLSIDVDLGFNKGIFGISAYRILSSDNREYFGIGLRDSLNFISLPATLSLSKESLFVISFSTNSCSANYYDTSIYRSGSLNLIKLDKTNRIIAGTFNATLWKPGCDTMRITEGRFDMKY